jgi:RNA polymerase sigma-54 factor
MALSPRLELRQSQTLVMTPQLQQAIKMLQLSNIELNEYVEQEVERNPLLEIGEANEGPADAEGDRHAPDRAESDGGLAAVDSKLKEPGDPSSGDDAPLDTSYENVFDSDGPAGSPSSGSGDAAGDPTLGPAGWLDGRGGGGGGGEGNPDLEQTLSEGASLHDHLEEQLVLAFADPTERMIGHYLIDLVNEAGYLTDTLEAVADRLGCAVEDAERVLAVLQTFDPPGVFARSLKECLAIQLREKNRLDPVMEVFLDHLELLARRDMVALRRACNVDGEDLAEMITDLQALNPKPGLAFGTEQIHAVVPDVYIREGGDGGWIVELNTDTLPKVLVNSRYYAELGRRSKDNKAKAYVTECLNSANWLVKSLDQRAKTILKVATEIVRQQDGFFAHGVTHLRPLNLRAIAEAIEMHESTVSRVTANKYLSCSRGIFEMKYFFTSSIPASGAGDAHSSEAVRFRIRELIDGEQPMSVLSDDQLVEILRKSGIEIARRTVAKYREAMHIPSSVQRRRSKTLSA